MRKIILILSLSLTILLFGACTAKINSSTVPEETDVAISQATPTAVIPVAFEPPVDNCVECHTDKQMLIETTAEEEEAAHGAESEGVG
jgi:hypothetical protein